MSYDGCEVSRAVLASRVFVNNVGDIGPTISSVHTANTKAVKMRLDGNFLRLELKEIAGDRRTVVELVPLTAVLHFTPVIK